MRTTRRRAAAALAALVLGAGLAPASHADVFIGWREYDRQLQPGAVTPYDGAPFSERYGYYAGPAFYLGTAGSYEHFVYMDYLDRLDRAEKFGYRIPAPPAFLVGPGCRPCGR